MKKLLKILQPGLHKGLAKNEEKLITLLNYFCVIFYVAMIFMSISDYFFADNYSLVISAYIYHTVVLAFIQFLHHKRKYTAARVLFVSESFLLFFVFCNFIEPGFFIEYFYILVPLFSLLFLKDRRLHIFYLVLSIVGFTIPKEFLHIYPDNLFSDPIAAPVLFISIYLLVIYFKSLNKKNESLLEAQKNSALNDKTLIENQKNELEEIHNFQNQFFINIAHEIRTPLTIIKGNITSVKKEYTNQSDKIVKTIHSLENQTLKIQRIVNDVLDLTKMDSNTFELKKTDIQFSSFLSRVFLSFHSNFQNKNIDYQLIDNSNKRIILSADSVYLEAALSNIIINALKYTDVDGFVHILMRQGNENNIIIEVQDSGIGIENDEIKKIFNRFYQADNKINRSGGSGIGLAFSKEIIQKHNGTITVKSEINKGSSFVISLPIKGFSNNIYSNEKTIIPNRVLDIKEKVSFQEDKITILLVDDHFEMRDYIKSILPNYNIIEASNGLEGIDIIKDNKIEYIITDYMMPKMDGYEFVKVLKEKEIETPVLMLTARSNFETKMQMLRLGIDDYLTKPFNEEELLVRIKTSLRNFSVRRQFIEDEKILPSETKDPKFIAELQTYVEKNCTEQFFSIPEICDKFALSQSSLYRKVKSLTGLSPKAFITEIRLQKARNLLIENPELSAKELALEVGFVNYTHFLKLYSARFGKT